MDTKEILSMIRGGLFTIYKAPKIKLWLRMDDVYDAHTDLNRRHRRGHNQRLLEVSEYVLRQELQMRNQGGFDLRDRVYYLSWAIEWYKYKEPRRNSEEYSDKQQALDQLKGVLGPLYEEEMRARVRRHEEFNAHP
jgi:hypothetical protein